MARLGRAAARATPIHRFLRWAARRRAGRLHVAVIGVLRDEGRVLAARHAFRDGAWSLPGGWMHSSEDPLRAVERELAEELALHVVAEAVVSCERQGGPTVDIGYHAITLGVRCRSPKLARAADLQLSSELSEARWLSADEAQTLLTPFELETIARASDHPSVASADDGCQRR